MTPDSRNRPPTAQTDNPDENGEMKGWLRRARSAFRSSTSYMDGNYRKTWEDSIRAFNNQHPSDSKYNAPQFDKRSKLYRPKIRSVIRKNEAAAAAAFFSNMDVVNITAGDQSNKAQQASAEIMKQLVQYRLSKSIPWFQTLLGGLQDAQVGGMACAHIHWKYEAETEAVAAISMSEEGVDAEASPPQTKVKQDKPAIDLVPLENIRFDPSANWIDPVNTSPFFIHLIPMYAMDVKERMESGDWIEGPLSAAAGSGAATDSTRGARNTSRDDPASADNRPDVDDYDIVWVQRHIHRRDGQDWDFYTLGDYALLSEPVPLTDTVFHGQRPYVLGGCILETHKTMPSGVPMLAKGLEDEINEIANQRIDNVKFALNKKWFAKRGVEVDLAGLVRNVPGGVVLMNDPINDVREVTWPDVTQSSYAEQQGLDMSMDELLGNFNPAALMTNGAGNAPARNMAMLNQSNGTLVEYLIRTFVETWVQPVLRQLILLEQKYETDEVVLALAGKNAQIFQKFGVDQVTDELLNQELTLTVSVGMGATDPTQKLQKFLAAMQAFSGMMKNQLPGVNMAEVGKEIFSHLGYQNGARFFTTDNPQVTALQQQVQQLNGALQQMQGKLKEKGTAQIIGLQKTRETNASKVHISKMHEENENRRALATHFAALNAPKQKAK